MNLDASDTWLNRAEKVIPGQTQTFSKRASWFPQGAYPLYLTRGSGPLVWDADGNRYTDFIMGLGSVILGYRHPDVDQAIMSILNEGIIFSLPHPIEIVLSEKIQSIVPCAERVRFSKTGSEVCQAAIRVARAYTGRNHIAYRGYHGWHSWYSSTTERARGTLSEESSYMHEFQYNDLSSLEGILTEFQCAAVIMEPVIFEPPRDGFLTEVKNLAHKHGSLLIFDEMVSGFRMDMGGAQKLFNVTPDLATFGKGVANGMPLAVLCGKTEFMRECEDIFFSTTFGGECLSLAAGLATIQTLERGSHKEIHEAGRYLRTLLQEDGIKTVGYDVRFGILLPNEDTALRSLFMQECASRGVLTHSFALNICAAHNNVALLDKVSTALSEAYLTTLDAQKNGTVELALRGKVIQPAFRRL